MENIYGYNENQMAERSENRIDRTKAILLSVLAVFVPLLFHIFCVPALQEFLYDILPFSSAQMDGIGILINCVRNLLTLIIITVGGFAVTKSKSGAVRFAGIFVFASVFAGYLSGVGDIFIGLFAGLDAVLKTLFENIVSILAGVLKVYVHIRLFVAFEERKTNRFVSYSVNSLIRRKMVKVIIAVIVLITIGNVFAAFSSAFLVQLIDMKAVTVMAQIMGLIVSFAVLFVFYRESFGIRKDRIDFIGLASSYYLPELITVPFAQLLTGVVTAVTANHSGTPVYSLIVSGTSVLSSVISSVFAIFVAFMVLKYFFPVSDEEISEEKAEDRAERILRNLKVSEKASES